MIARRMLACLTLLCSLGLPGAARAGATVEAITLQDVPVNVVLPDGYDTDATTRYPVVYLLHGYSENERTWLDMGNLATFAADKEVIFVTPGGDPDGWYSDWRNGAHQWESFHIGTLIPYIDANYRTIASRAGRAIAGLSMGGFGSMSYAARHPDLFSAAASFSGAVDTTDKSPVAELAIAGAFAPKSGDDRFAVWGNPLTDEVWWHAHNPTDLAANLEGMSLYVANGDGIPEADDPVNPTGMAGEREILDMAQNFDAALSREGIDHTVNWHGGLHTWKYWTRDIAGWWRELRFDTPAPAAFDYRAVEPTFSVWGWRFEADPARAPEFLQVRDASCARATLTGSGTETVTTGACFTPGQMVVALAGNTATATTADDDGRITFTVDLGPAHTLQQYTAAERALDQTPGYFVTRGVTFTSN